MRLDFSDVGRRAFSEKPMSFIDQAPKDFLAAIIDLVAIETGNRAAREHWQHKQLQNLLRHAARSSAFWRERIGTKNINSMGLSDLPILTRHDLIRQVETEGTLLPRTGPISTRKHATSGSSGTPVQFFVSEMNEHYNAVRSLAQYFMEGRDLSLNRTRIREADAPIKGISVKKEKYWTGPLASLVKSGENKEIEYFNFSGRDCHKLVAELKKDDVGYLIAGPNLIDTISSSFDLDILKAANTAMWIPFGAKPNSKLRETFTDLGIPVRATYSSEEVGYIGTACSKCSTHYHAATSNVVVEVVDRRFEIDGMSVGKVIVTHLHSYATPFIRYDLGDLACLCVKCPCGHDGPTIYNLEGRESSVIKRRDGRLSPFFIRGKELQALVDFTEYRMRQTAFEKILIEFGGRSELSANEVAGVKGLLKQRAGPEFEIEVKACEQIDWGQSRKRLGFRCEV